MRSVVECRLSASWASAFLSSLPLATGLFPIVSSPPSRPRPRIPTAAFLRSASGLAISSANMALAYDSLLNRARLTFPGLAGQRLADGDYRLSVARGNITDVSGKTLSTDFSLNFHALTGDVNGDRVTNDEDLFLVFSD